MNMIYLCNGRSESMKRDPNMKQIPYGLSESEFVNLIHNADFKSCIGHRDLAKCLTKVTGKKMDQKMYYRHSDFVGGFKEMTLAEMMDKKPEMVVELAVKGMLPKGPLGRQMLKKLHVYAGPEHAQQAQKPEVLTF